MSRHEAEVRWTLGTHEDFLAGRYSRHHRLRFGATTVEGSSSPQIVPAPWSTPDAVDPEAAFVASLSACHMLWFLDFARRAGVEVRGYVDSPVGELGPDARGRQAITHVVLRPFVDCEADKNLLTELHDKAHEACFIANSVLTEVLIEPRGALLKLELGEPV